ncbi:MAG: hypothetical protein AB7O68_14900 [Pirellulales bacterium]
MDPIRRRLVPIGVAIVALGLLRQVPAAGQHVPGDGVSRWVRAAPGDDGAGDRAFQRAKERVSSGEYAWRRAETKRLAEINRQQSLEALVQWRSGIVAASPAGPPWSTPGMPSPPVQTWPGSNYLYSPYWFGPFEPTPFWPGYIFGYPFIDPIEQPVGSKMTAQGGDPAKGYVYEPLYVSDQAAAAARSLDAPRRAKPATPSTPARPPARRQRVREL